MRELILDYSTWRCGDHGDYKLGMGETYLLNEENFMCCLGQFTPQINREVSKEDMLGISDPGGLNIKVLSLNKPRRNDQYTTTVLSDQAVIINDEEFTTPEEKIVALKELFKKQGYSIKVINNPNDNIINSRNV